mgnify:CR=1
MQGLYSLGWFWLLLFSLLALFYVPLVSIYSVVDIKFFKSRYVFSQKLNN